jgi:hypothetical protein
MQMLDADVHEPKYRYFARTPFPCIKKNDKTYDFDFITNKEKVSSPESSYSACGSA